MQTAIRVGHEAGAAPEALTAIADAICRILEAGHEFRQDQATITQALQVLERSAPTIGGVSISGCQFDSTTHTHPEDEPHA